ncbi:MAG: M48 family metallopeptidase [Clostridia bacterium]|nr:M48 family metallopeptidase [Clostridia bacterium]
MTLDSRYYMHNSDRIALQALKSIPGFTQLLKAFMKVWNEKQFRIQNMSSNLRINEKQLSKYYDMLPPICEKLGIEIPELYLTLDVNPNAYTYGDTKPFIVITSGLIETVPEELIPTVLAHECGHIACHHCLYTTMGSILLNGTSSLLSFWGITDLVTIPIQIAFYYWMRCSEYSADRAAALYDGTSDKIVEMCMRFSGLDKDIGICADKETFLNQALEYKALTDESAWNKTLEFLMLSKADHPLNAVRAYECNEWTKEERFTKMADFLNIAAFDDETTAIEYLGEIPVTEASKSYIGKNYIEISEKIKGIGFSKISLLKLTEKTALVKEGQVLNIRINDKDGFDIGEWYPIDSEIIIEYYEAETEEEVAAAHPGQIRIPDSSRRYIGRIYTEVVAELQEKGFFEINLEEHKKSKKGWLSKEGEISRISINGQTQFEKGEWFAEKATIEIIYHTFNTEN